MDCYSPWRLKRERVYVAYPSEQMTSEFLRGPVNQALKLKTNGNFLTDHEISHIVDCLGGSLADIDTSISGFEVLNIFFNFFFFNLIFFLIKNFFFFNIFFIYF